MTTVYLIRHSKPLKVNNDFNKDSLQLRNEKEVLSIEGEEIAQKHFAHDEFQDIDFIFSSNYVRAIATAKYLAAYNKTNVNIVSECGERKFGIQKWEELPKDFEQQQNEDEMFKMPLGESQREVRERMENALEQVLTICEGKKVAIVSHATALSYLFKKWCEMNYSSECYFRGQPFFDGVWNYCETFQLTFDNQKNLVDIKNIRYSNNP